MIMENKTSPVAKALWLMSFAFVGGIVVGMYPLSDSMPPDPSPPPPVQRIELEITGELLHEHITDEEFLSNFVEAGRQ